MASKLKIKVNGLVHNVTASLDTPLLVFYSTAGAKHAFLVVA
jgi:hypothetical protein